MNPLSPLPLSNYRRLGAVALFLVGLVGVVTPLLTGVSVKAAPDSRTQPIYLAYTTNNVGYLFTCG